MRGRTRVDGQGRKEKRFRRAATPFALQLAAINYYAECGSVGATINRFYPSLAPAFKKSKAHSIQWWAKNRVAIEIRCDSSQTRSMSRAPRTGRGITLGEDDEKTLVIGINFLRKDGVPLRTATLRRRARRIAKPLALPESEAVERVWTFAARIQELTATHNIEKVYNADQTGVFFEYVPKVTVSNKGMKTVWVRPSGKGKERLTVMLLGDSKGKKYQPFIVVHTTTPKLPGQAKKNDNDRHGFGKAMWKKLKPVQGASGSQLYRNRTAWWNSRLSLTFLKYHFGARDD